MLKVLFLIHDLGQGGAEKVLVNLVNNMDENKFDIHVTALFGGGVNEQFLKPHIKYKVICKNTVPGNSHIMKFLSPRLLHKICVREVYDIEISYLEGPSARIISGCMNPNTKTICWIHSNHYSIKELASSFRSIKETVGCYSKYNQIVCVSQFMRENFCQWVPMHDKCRVLYNTVESDVVREYSKEACPEIKNENCIKIISVGSLKVVKGFDRLLRIVNRLNEEKLKVHLYLLGRGPLKDEFEKYIRDNHLEDSITLLGYHTNPYKFVSKCDLYVCSSHSEGFSTSVTEALIVGTPVCTVDVSGMKEMLGENNEYGVVVNNDENALFFAIRELIEDEELLLKYKKKAIKRGYKFSKRETVEAVENMLMQL